MKIKIWGARGSIPSPIRPDDIREKIISAILSISKIEKGEFREELISAILENPQSIGDTEGRLTRSEVDEIYQKAQKRRRRIVQTYLDSLSPLAATTAGGNTPSIEIQSGEELFIIDAGSGIRELGLELMKGACGQGQGVIHLFFSHPHWDHIQGFPFFRPAFVPGNKIFIYSVHDMELALRRQQEFISFPISLTDMQAEINFVPINPEETYEIGGIRVRTIRNEHPGASYAFRFEKGSRTFVYASDASYPTEKDQRPYDLRPYINFFADADVLIFDAQFTQREADEKEDWGHSSSFVGVELAQQAQVKNLVLYHYDPTYSDKDLEKILEDTLKFQRSQYPNRTPVEVMIAQEGQIFDLTPSPMTQLQQVPGGKAAILKPSGVFNESVAAELRKQLDELKQNGWPPQLIVDMSSVELLQVAGLRALVKLRKEQPGIPMVLAGPSLNVQQLIELAGYFDLFAIYPSVHAALNALQARETLNLPGQMIKNRYHIEAKIGDGHLGTVFKANDTRLNTPVALKILSPSFSEGAIERFLQQGREIIELAHPNIVNVHECGEDRGLSYMVEEFIEGQTLQDLLDEQPGQPFPLELSLSIAENIAQALEYAHAHGVIHGDLKPKNLLFTGDQLKISDFGLGRLESGKSLLNVDIPLPLVTAHYLAPEQVLGHPIDARTDLYALGVILYKLFTGQLPFEGSDQEVMERHRNTPPRPPCELNPHLSRSLEYLTLRLLDKDPNKRYATARQIRRVLASILTSPSSKTAAQRLSRQQRPALVNRAEPLQWLLDLWAETRQGRGRLVFISGEAGIGKTRLIQELVQQLDEATILTGKCWELERNSAYRPFIQALKTYFASVPSEIANKYVGQVLSEAAGAIPEIQPIIAQILPNFQSLLANLENSTSFSLAQAVAQASLERPWLLILEDLQWADQSSLHLLHYLARHCGRMALMIVATYRNNDSPDDKSLTEMLSSLNRYLPYVTISLDRLAENEVQDMLEGILFQAVPADLTTAIYRRTKGNPFYVEELARGLVDEDIIRWRDDHWHFTPVVEADLPPTIHEAILRRVHRLNKETQTLLNQAAVLGYTFKFSDLHAISDLSEWDALENLDTALERQLIRELPHEGVLSFSHPQIQETLYEDLSPPKRWLMHREAGDALEQHSPSEYEQLASELAYHFFQAKALEKGLIYSIKAATQADSLYASQQGLNWYTYALDTLDQLGLDELTQERRFELILARERIYDYLGERQAQAADLNQLLNLAQTANDPAKQALVHNRQARYNRLINQFTVAGTEAQAGLIAARQANQPTLEGESLLQLAHLAINQADFETAREHIQAVQKLLAGNHQQRLEARILNAWGIITHHLHGDDQAENFYQQALALNQANGDRYGQATSLHYLANLHLDQGSYSSAISYCQQALEINRAIAHRRGEAICLQTFAAIYEKLGQYRVAYSCIEEAYLIYQQVNDWRGQGLALSILGAIHLASGDDRVAKDNLEQALEIFQRSKLRAYEGRAWLALGLALEAGGETEKAGEAYQQAYAIQLESGNEAGALEAQAGLARCFLTTGDIETALTKAEPCLVQRELPGVKDPIRLYLTLYQTLQAANKVEEALAILEEGYLLLQKRSETITDPNLRILFLKNVPENKELLLQYGTKTTGDQKSRG